MREVGVHLDYVFVLTCQGIPKPRQVRRRETPLPLPMNDADTRLSPSQAIGDLPGAVRGVVVHDQHVQIGPRDEDSAHEPLQVLTLVVGRDDHHGAGGTARSLSAASDTPSSPTIMKMSYLVLRNRPNRQHRSVGGTSCSLPRGRVPPRAPNSPRPHGARRTPGQGVSWAARRRAHCAHGRDTAVVELMSSPPVRALRAVATDPAAAGTSPGPDVAAQPAPAAEGRSHTARLWLAAALGATALGLTLRIVGLADGLPYHFHWDEPTIMNRVIRMGGGDLNPHFFYYPTLLMYVLLAAQGALYAVGHVLHTYPSTNDFAVAYLTDST